MMVPLLLIQIWTAPINVSTVPDPVVTTLTDNGWTGTQNDGCECLHRPQPLPYI